MATFKKIYSVSELLKLVEKRSLIPFCWRNGQALPEFYLVDSRRSPELLERYEIRFCSNKSNFYRFKNKINSLPLCLNLLLGDEYYYYYSLQARSTILGNPLCYNPVPALKKLSESFSSDYKVRVYVL